MLLATGYKLGFPQATSYMPRAGRGDALRAAPYRFRARIR